MTEVIQHACYDVPDSRDYLYEEVRLGGEKKKKPLPKKWTLYDQTLDPNTMMACTRYGMGHVSNIQNIQEYEEMNLEYKEIDPIVPRLEYVKLDPRALTNGATLQSAVNQALKAKLIEGYASVRGFENGIDAIDRGDYIFTGAVNYTIINKDGESYLEFIGKKAGGHAFMIYDYDDKRKHFIIGDSWKARKVFLRYDNFDKLFTRYAIIDKKDVIEEYKKKKLIKEIMNKNSDLWRAYQDLKKIGINENTDKLASTIQGNLHDMNTYFRSVGF